MCWFNIKMWQFLKYVVLQGITNGKNEGTPFIY